MVAVAVSAGKSAVPNGVQFLVSISVLLQRVWLDNAVNQKKRTKKKKKTDVAGPGKENLHGSAWTLSRFRIEINPSTSGVGRADDMANIVLEVVTVDSQFRIP